MQRNLLILFTVVALILAISRSTTSQGDGTVTNDVSGIRSNIDTIIGMLNSETSDNATELARVADTINQLQSFRTQLDGPEGQTLTQEQIVKLKSDSDAMIAQGQQDRLIARPRIGFGYPYWYKRWLCYVWSWFDGWCGYGWWQCQYWPRWWYYPCHCHCYYYWWW